MLESKLKNYEISYICAFFSNITDENLKIIEYLQNFYDIKILIINNNEDKKETLTNYFYNI